MDEWDRDDLQRTLSFEGPESKKNRKIKKSNRKARKYLNNLIDSTVAHDGIDIYGYCSYNVSGGTAGRSRRELILRHYPSKLYKLLTICAAISVQILIPCILLTVQISEGNFYPKNNNALFRFVGFLILLYTTSDLRNQIVSQMSWVMIDNNRILHRIDPTVERPRIRCMYVGMYVNIIISIVITTNTYMLYCNSCTIVDLITSTVILNFLLMIDNTAVTMMSNAARVEARMIEAAKEQIKSIIEAANRKNVRVVRRFRPTVEHVLFYITTLYSLALPLLFLFYDVRELELGLDDGC